MMGYGMVAGLLVLLGILWMMVKAQEDDDDSQNH